MNSHPCLCLSCRAFVILVGIIAKMWHLRCFICDFCTIELSVPYICAYRNGVALCAVKNLQPEHNAMLRGYCMEMWLAKTKIVSLDGPNWLQLWCASVLAFLLGLWRHHKQHLSLQVSWDIYTLSWFGCTGVDSCVCSPRREQSTGESFLCHRSFHGGGNGWTHCFLALTAIIKQACSWVVVPCNSVVTLCFCSA